MVDGRIVELRTIWAGLRDRAQVGDRLLLYRERAWRVLIDLPGLSRSTARLVPVGMTRESMAAAEKMNTAVNIAPGERVDIAEVGIYVVCTSECHAAGGWGLELEKVD